MSARPASAIMLCARQEFVLTVRSRWTQVFAAVFAGIAVAVAGSGYVLSGGHGIEDFSRIAVSLVQAILLLVPVTALVSGVLALSPERGSAELLFSQPVPRRAILLGTVLGLFAALGAAETLGFGAAGILVFATSGSEGLTGFVLLVCSALVLTAVFLAGAAAIAAGGTGRRVRALAIALVTWFVAVVLFDVVALGLASLLRSGTASRVLIMSVLINPVDAVRTAALLGTEGTAAFGTASLAFLRFTHGPVGAALLLGASLVAWIVAPLGLAVRRMNRADL